jgi:hypothetical protein
MTDTTLIELSASAPRANHLGAFARRFVFARLATLRDGLLRIRESGEVHEFGSQGSGIDAIVTVLDRRSTPRSPSAARSARASRTCWGTGRRMISPR